MHTGRLTLYKRSIIRPYQKTYKVIVMAMCLIVNGFDLPSPIRIAIVGAVRLGQILLRLEKDTLGEVGLLLAEPRDT